MDRRSGPSVASILSLLGACLTAFVPRAALAASLLRVDQETFLVYRNYETLLTYNCAHSYATAVGLLADRLDGRLESWPAAKKTAKPARRATSGSNRRRSR